MSSSFILFDTDLDVKYAYSIFEAKKPVESTT
jgi:hypothetical protein